jgi:hypothetical protein
MFLVCKRTECWEVFFFSHWLVLKNGWRGAIHALPHTSMSGGIYLIKHKDNLT